MFGARSRSHIGPLPQQPAGRCAGASAAARAGRHSPAVRLSTAAYPAQARGHRHEPQEAAPALPRGTAAGAPARRAQAGVGNQGADGDPAGRQPTLEPGLPVRCARRRPSLPHPGDRRRLHPGVPGAGRRYLAVGPAGRARARCPHHRPRPTCHDASPTTAPS